LSRPGTATRRFGYVVAVLVNGALWYAVNQWPGWSAVPFLTPDTELVLAWVNASILVSLVANLVYLARDPRWLRALGDVATTSVGLVVLVRVWQVFPLDVDSDTSGWGLLARVLLGIGIVGSAIGILTAFATFVRACAARRRRGNSGTRH
jgi:hypothetical protein